jgi:hypothetical protein
MMVASGTRAFDSSVEPPPGSNNEYKSLGRVLILTLEAK